MNAWTACSRSADLEHECHYIECNQLPRDDWESATLAAVDQEKLRVYPIVAPRGPAIPDPQGILHP